MKGNSGISSYTKHRVISIYPNYRGFGFAVFEGPAIPLDWGNVTFKLFKTSAVSSKINKLLDFYQPDVLVTRDYEQKEMKRRKNTIRYANLAIRTASINKINTQTYTSTDVSNVFEQFGAKTKFDRSMAIIEFLPVFSVLKPKMRKPWMSEDARMTIFEAIAQIFTHFYLAKQ